MRWVGFVGWLHLAFFGVLIPWSAIRAQKLIQSRPLPLRRKYFASVILQITFFALISIFVAKKSWIVIFPRRMPSLIAIGIGVVFLAVAIATGWPRWRKAILERKKIVALFMPTNRNERFLWVLISALAGFGEEITWRGVQTALLTRLTGSLIVAIVFAIVMFSIAHAMQGWQSVVVIAAFSAGFHLLVWLSGSLYVAMVVHFLYDLTAGFAYAHLARKHGYFIAAREEQTAATYPEHSETQTI